MKNRKVIYGICTLLIFLAAIMINRNTHREYRIIYIDLFLKTFQGDSSEKADDWIADPERAAYWISHLPKFWQPVRIESRLAWGRWRPLTVDEILAIVRKEIEQKKLN